MCIKGNSTLYNSVVCLNLGISVRIKSVGNLIPYNAERLFRPKRDILKKLWPDLWVSEKPFNFVISQKFTKTSQKNVIVLHNYLKKE